MTTITSVDGGHPAAQAADKSTEPSLVAQMEAALSAPAARAEPDLADKPTARAIISTLRPLVDALRNGTAPACNGRRMSWREIAGRLAGLTGLSEDSLRKAYVSETGQRRRAPPRPKANAPTPDHESARLRIEDFPEKPIAVAKMASASGDAFGPLFDD